MTAPIMLIWPNSNAPLFSTAIAATKRNFLLAAKKTTVKQTAFSLTECSLQCTMTSNVDGTNN